VPAIAVKLLVHSICFFGVKSKLKLFLVFFVKFFLNEKKAFNIKITFELFKKI
jgi:hypothetical protein